MNQLPYVSGVVGQLLFISSVSSYDGTKDELTDVGHRVASWLYGRNARSIDTQSTNGSIWNRRRLLWLLTPFTRWGLVTSLHMRDESNHFIVGRPIVMIILLSLADVRLRILIVAPKVR